MLNKEEALQVAITLAGKRIGLAKKIGVTTQAISLWVRNGLPADRAMIVSEATGGRITVAQLKGGVDTVG